MHEEIVAHLRALRADSSTNMAWSSALVWAEKAVLLSDSMDDILWLVDALVTNGQYRQAEEWLTNPRYSAKCRATTAGRYLGSVVAMRLGRAEDALELLSLDDAALCADLVGAAGAAAAAVQTGRQQPGSSIMQTPTANKTAGGMPPPLALPGQTAGPATTRKRGHAKISVPPLNPKALMLYMQGAAVIQLSNIGGNEMTPSIKQLNAKSSISSLSSADQRSLGSLSSTPMLGNRPPRSDSLASLGSMGSLVARLWSQALRIEPRCWEAWTGIREYGLMTGHEESRFIDSLDWMGCCGGSADVGRFFKRYCQATQTAYSLSDMAVEATGDLLQLCPRLIEDPTLRTIQAARLLSVGSAKESLEYTVRVLEYRHVPDPIATAIHITALTVLYSKKALFRIAHELAEEFGISSIKRAEIEPADTYTSVLMSTTAGVSGGGSSVGSSSPSDSISRGSMPTPRGVSMGASVAGTGRVRAGARGLLIPETPSRVANGPGASGSNLRRTSTVGAASGAMARSVVQSAPAAATAAWRGLWGLPTWSHPGPPVLATYPCALGPAQGPSVVSDAPISTLNTLTSTNAQSVGSPTQYEFIGASLAWYAIGCYYLVSAALMVCPDISQRDWPLTGLSVSIAAGGMDERDASTVGLRHTQPLSPEIEHTLAEARRWLAKTTLASPRSIIAWVAFAHTFVIAGEWEAATRALHTAVGLCGCDDIVHGGGRDSSASALPPQTPSKLRPAGGPKSVERGSQLAHIPLASLGSVYLQMGDLGMAESCFDASARCLSGYRIAEWLSAWRPTLESLANADILAWISAFALDADSTDPVHISSLADPQLLNDIGVMYYNSGDMESARVLFIMSLVSLRTSSSMHHRLNMAFRPASSRKGISENSVKSRSQESQAYSALVKANLGNVLRHTGDHQAALQCLREAAAHAPSNSEIQLSVAFTLHMSAINSSSDLGSSICSDLDQAVDLYHRILSEHPGDPVTTDLLTLALELSVNMQKIPAYGGVLAGMDRIVSESTEDIIIRDPSDLGMPEMDERAGGTSLLDLIPKPGSAYEPSLSPDSINYGGADNLQSATPSLAEAEDEDSDEVMDIEEDSDSNNDSGSDMAMDE
ncbi:anaphase-promoting complex subunit Cut9 [Coemansia erecta]|uniref:Anaphase-promoting complex subunit Cut9 n=1 Tax=Coemansia erecta TaxID=147472 RepID=A0A9W7XY36_9FUNG|nr:anaphase-promoting complex subunit Cut9 [Coemansia erecta]